jgi:hypothetical protein
MGIKSSLAESWKDARLQEKKKKKALAKGKPSIAPATSLTYALRRYKIVTESQQDAKLVQIASRVWGKQRWRGGGYRGSVKL